LPAEPQQNAGAESQEEVREADGAVMVKTVYGGYMDSVSQKEDEEEDEEESQVDAYKREQGDIARLEAFIRCCGTDASFKRQADSKQKIIDAMKEMGLTEKPFELKPPSLQSKLATRARQQVLEGMLGEVKVSYKKRYGLDVEAESEELVRDADGTLFVKTVYGGNEDEEDEEPEQEPEQESEDDKDSDLDPNNDLDLQQWEEDEQADDAR